MALTAVVVDDTTQLGAAALNKFIHTVGGGLSRGVSRALFQFSGNTVTSDDNIAFSVDNGAGSWDFTFTTTYSVAPVIVVTPASASAYKAGVINVATTGFRVVAFNDGTTATDVNVNIIAIGS